MKDFNLTRWALAHQQLVYFFVALTFIAGLFTYPRLGRMEDPEYVIRQMIVSVAWPGATAKQVEEQVTDKLEKKLQDTPGLDYLKSYSKAGQAVIYVNLKESVPAKDVRPTWLEVRNLANDIKGSLPQGVVGPAFNDRFDDVFGSIYALTASDYSYEELRAQAEQIRRILLGVNSVKRVELIGVQPEKVYIEIQSNKLAQLGLDPQVILQAVQAQSSMNPAGMLETKSDNVYLRVSGLFDNLEQLNNLPIRAAGRTFRLGDIAKVSRGYVEPSEPKMYYNGQPAVGLAVSMDSGGNIINLGLALHKAIAMIRQELPLGLEISQVANQAQVVEESIGEFTKSLWEAIIIVLAVSFLSLGVRCGWVVTLCIPLVLAGVFAGMSIASIDLHKVSLGALIISLGLLIDDATIAVEMMEVKLAQGWERVEAACYAYQATAFPMLTGTLITCAGFIPIGFAKGASAEFTSSLFPVITIALLFSWVVAVMVTPLFGYVLIKPRRTENINDQANKQEVYNTKFYNFFKKILVWCLNNRKLVLGFTIACFVLAVFSLKFVKKEFFPPSTRPELIVELTLPEGASLLDTEQQAKKLALLLEDEPLIKQYSYYVGKGAPRFILTLEPKLPANNFAQFIIVAKDIEARKQLQSKLEKQFNQGFEEVRSNIKLIQTGPPSDYPVMLRVSGYQQTKVLELANKVGQIMQSKPELKNINYDWQEKAKSMKLSVDQDKARLLGITSQSLAKDLQAQISGLTIGEYYEADKTLGILFRLDKENRKTLAEIKNLPIHIGSGAFVPLEQIAKISYEAEEGTIWRYNLKPTITVQADVVGKITGNDATQQVYSELQQLRDQLPFGYSIEVAGSSERSKTSVDFLLQTVPVMSLVIVILLMLQLQRVSLVVIALLTLPLGIIGVSVAMLITGLPLGFVAQLGILALSGMIVRNSVILLDQIEQHLSNGETLSNAIVDSTILRFRPIMLTAATAILGMVPLISSTFWGPMAVAIGGGLLGATVMTLLVLPTIYATWFKAPKI